MRKASIWILTIAGLIGLLAAVGSGSGHRGGFKTAGPGQPPVEQPMVCREGFPHTWLEWETRPNRHLMNIYFARWSFGILIASISVLCGAAAIKWRDPVAANASAPPGSQDH